MDHPRTFCHPPNSYVSPSNLDKASFPENKTIWFLELEKLRRFKEKKIYLNYMELVDKTSEWRNKQEI